MSGFNAARHYRRFPSFAEWSTIPFNPQPWTAAKEILEKRRQAAGEAATKSTTQTAMRGAAAATGAIENLYEDRGLTMTALTQAANWESHAPQIADSDTLKMIEAQLQGYQQALDISTRAQPLSEAWIRNLHSLVCAPQERYTIHTSEGPRERPLEKGAYKTEPNHVTLRDGSIHEYAPVPDTSPEMSRLVEELRTDEFESAHPCVQASFAHYAFVAIHPFPDGNGRVARVLASVYLLKAASVPLILFVDQKQRYFDALAKADAGDRRAFADYLAEQASDGLLLVAELLRAQSGPTPADRVRGIRNLYQTTSGLSLQELDAAANKLVDEVLKILTRQFGALGIAQGQIAVNALWIQQDYPSHDSTLRRPVVEGPRILQLTFTTVPPAAANHVLQLRTFVSRSEVPRPVAQLKVTSEDEDLTIAVDELYPRISASATMRMEAWTETFLSRQLDYLVKLATAALRAGGY